MELGTELTVNNIQWDAHLCKVCKTVASRSPHHHIALEETQLQFNNLHLFIRTSVSHPLYKHSW